MSQKPNAIIFGQSRTHLSSSHLHEFTPSQSLKQFFVLLPSLPGGVNTCSRELTSLLVPLEGEPLVSVSIRFRSLVFPSPQPQYRSCASLTSTPYHLLQR